MPAEYIQIELTTGVGVTTLTHVGEQADHSAFCVVRVVCHMVVSFTILTCTRSFMLILKVPANGFFMSQRRPLIFQSYFPVPRVGRIVRMRSGVLVVKSTKWSFCFNLNVCNWRSAPQVVMTGDSGRADAADVQARAATAVATAPIAASTNAVGARPSKAPSTPAKG